MAVDPTLARKIQDLPPAGPLTGAELTALSQAGVTVKATVADLAAGLVVSGTPTEILYFDALGHVTGDTLFTREEATGDTLMRRTFVSGILPIVTGLSSTEAPPFVGGPNVQHTLLTQTDPDASAIVGTLDLSSQGGPPSIPILGVFAVSGVSANVLGFYDVSTDSVALSLSAQGQTNNTSLDLSDVGFALALSNQNVKFKGDCVTGTLGWQTTNGSFTLPDFNGTPGQVLTDDGIGGLYWSTVGGGGGGSITIGDPVTGGTPKQVLYTDNTGNLFSDALFTRDSVTNKTNIMSTSIESGYTTGLTMSTGLNAGVTLQHLNAFGTIGTRIDMQNHRIVAAADTLRMSLDTQFTKGLDLYDGSQLMLKVSADTASKTTFGYGALVNDAAPVSNNAAFGYGAGSGITNGSRNTFLGNSANTSTGNLNSAIALGFGAQVNTDHQMTIGAVQSHIDTVFFAGNNGSGAGTPSLAMKKDNAFGLDSATGQWDFSTGRSTGSRDGGSFTWSISRRSASSSTPNLEEEVFRLNQSEAYFSQRVWTSLGSATAANDLVCDPNTGRSNTFTVSGPMTASINGIDAQWASAQQIIMIFTGSPTLKHNTPCGLAFRKMKLAGSVDAAMVPDAVIGFVFDGTYFQQTFRKMP